MKLELFPLYQPVLKKILATFADLTIHGKENVPRKEPLIVISNHLSTMDPVLISIAIDRQPVFLAKKELFWFPPFSLALRALGIFPVDRSKADMKALRWAHTRLAEGRAMVIFPEGTRSKNFQLGKGNIGAALLAATTGYTILPVGITGTEIFQKIFQLLKPSGSMSVNVGVPFRAKEVTQRPNRKMLELVTKEMMTQIACLLPKERQGLYADTTEHELTHTAYISNGTSKS